jgi:2-methylcitrate dehydratase PrpD
MVEAAATAESLEEWWNRLGFLETPDIPADVVEVAKHCILDWFGCALAGSREPAARIVFDEVRDMAGPATAIGTELRLAVLPAALVNGTAGHALDFDDTNVVMGGHPTAPVLPAILAIAEERGTSGPKLISALVTGIELESRLGAALGAAYAKGWHLTSTVGVLGAAAAVSRLLDLDAAGAVRALGIAASQAGGLKANFGTMTKPFHAGHAAERGLLAARLSARGFTASGEAIGGRQGLARATGSGQLESSRLTGEPGTWLMLQTLFKYHAACYLTHAAIEAARSVRDRSHAANVKEVTVTVAPSLLDVCAIPNPRTGLEAKFSLAAAVSFAMVGLDTTDTATYSPESLANPDVRALIPSIRVKTDAALRNTQSRVSILTESGAIESDQDTGVPEVDLHRQGVRLHEKFLRLATPVVGQNASADLAAKIEALTEVSDVRELLVLASARAT